LRNSLIVVEAALAWWMLNSNSAFCSRCSVSNTAARAKRKRIPAMIKGVACGVAD
jgi:hypothetical protein